MRSGPYFSSMAPNIPTSPFCVIKVTVWCPLLMETHCHFNRGDFRAAHKFPSLGNPGMLGPLWCGWSLRWVAPLQGRRMGQIQRDEECGYGRMCFRWLICRRPCRGPRLPKGADAIRSWQEAPHCKKVNHQVDPASSFHSGLLRALQSLKESFAASHLLPSPLTFRILLTCHS